MLSTALPLTSPEEAARYRALGLWRDETISDRFLTAAARHRDKIALVIGDRTYTYADLLRMVENVAGNLLSLGLRPGEIVAMQSPNSEWQAVVNLALNRIGLVYLPLHDSWRERGTPLARKPKPRRSSRAVSRLRLSGDAGTDACRSSGSQCDFLRQRAAPARDFRGIPAFGLQLGDARHGNTGSRQLMYSGGTTALSKISR